MCVVSNGFYFGQCLQPNSRMCQLCCCTGWNRANPTQDQIRICLVYSRPVEKLGCLLLNTCSLWYPFTVPLWMLLTFVLACRLLCSKELTAYSVQLSNALPLQFCKKAEHLYGKGFVTPNMHMHMYLKSCVLDYGPLHGFWLFAFERYSGKTRKYHQ